MAESPWAATHRLDACAHHRSARSTGRCAWRRRWSLSSHVLAEVAPEWVLAQVPTDWGERYGARLEEERLPKADQERLQYADHVGADGWRLLAALHTPTTPDWMKTLPAVTTLRLIWEQQFEPLEQGGHWRQEPVLPAAELITSPYDLDARTAKKRAIFWTGYQVHFTQACE